MKIAICGSAGTGKTTLATAFAAKVDCAIIAECYEEFFDSNCDFIKPTNLLQQKIFETLELKNRIEDKRREFVADRCPVDLFNLWLSRGFGDDRKKTVDFYNRCRSYIRKYDCIVVLPWSALPLKQVEFKSSRRRRVVNSWTQLYNHSTMIGLLQQWVAPNRLLPVPFGMVDICARVEFIRTSLIEG